MNAVQRSLRSFRSPITWAAIGLLLLNDHVLKAAAPSWLTGKLSDFAGLFFFPFLVALALGPVLDRRDVPSRTTGRLAFVLTALGFGLIKTVPLANQAAEALWTPLYGRPAAIALDPADLLALAVLLPAWRLWKRPLASEVVLRRQPSRRRYLLPLMVAVLASVATSPARDDLIMRVGVHQGELYARSEAIYYDGYYARFSVERADWEELNTVSTHVRALLEEEATLPSTVCAEGNDRTCYQVRGDKRVYTSMANSEIWQVAWEFPENRLKFAERIREGFASLNDMGPFDLALLPIAGNGYYVAVAMGSEGMLMRFPDGTWQRQVVMAAEPTPIVATQYFDVTRALVRESAVWFGLALIYMNILFGFIWRSPRLVLLLLLIDIAVLLILALVMAAFAISPFIVVVGICNNEVALLTLLIAALVVRYKWKEWQKPLSEPRSARAAWVVWVSASIGAYLIGGLPFVMWTLGVMNAYQVALWLAILLTAIVMIAGARWTLQLMAAAREEAALPGIVTDSQ